MALAFAYLAVWSALFSGLVALGDSAKRPSLRPLAFILLALCALAAIAAGLTVLFSGEAMAAQRPLGLPWLSGFFFFAVGVLVLAVNLYGPGCVNLVPQCAFRVLGFSTGLFVAGILLVLIASDAFVFMIAGGLLPVSSYFLITLPHEQAPNRRAGFLYLLMALVGLAILLSLGVFAGAGGGFTLGAMRGAVLSETWASIVLVLAFVGFGLKTGRVPLQAGLPEAHPAAHAPGYRMPLGRSLGR